MPFTADDLELIQTPRFRRRFERRLVARYSGCFEWQGSTNGTGRGKIRIRVGLTESTHRVSWMQAHKRLIPPGMEIDHRCRNTICARSSHLELVTHNENIRRAAAFRAGMQGRLLGGAATMRPRDGKYQVRWRDYTGEKVRQRGRSFPTREAAEAFMAQISEERAA